MDPWLDSLSEDWVSQRGSSSPMFSGKTLSDPDSISTAKTSNNSRGFRTLSRTKPTSIDRKTKSQRSWPEIQGSTRRGGGILVERDLNDNTVARPQSGYVKSIATRLDNAAAETRGRRASSTWNSISSRSTRRHQTVHQKSVSASPQKDRRALLTPEWKRRLLGRNPAGGDLCDLFSPIGLEKMFQPPPASQGHPPLSAKPLNLDHRMPSDLLAGPNRERMGAEMQSPEQSRRGLPEGVGADANDEKVDTSCEVGMPTTENPPSKDVSGQTLNIESGERDDLRQQETVPSGDGRVSEPSHQVTCEHGPDQIHVESGNMTNGSACGIEDERNEDFTPILISRRNTADGGIDYGPSEVAQHQQAEIEGETKPPDETANTFGSEDCPGPHWLKSGQTTLGSIEMASTQSYDLPSSPHFGKLDHIPGLKVHDKPSAHPLSQLQNALSSPSSAVRIGLAHESPDPDAQSESVPSVRTVIQLPNEPENRVPVVTNAAASFKSPPANEHEEGQGILPPKSPGCALKLFDNYDTFTNGRLLQRMETLNEAAEEVEAEIQAHEGRVPPALSPRRRDRQRDRDVTIMYSSPVVSQSFQFSARDPAANGSRLPREVSVLDPENSLAEVIRELNAGPSSHNASSSRPASMVLPVRSSSFAAPRHVSFGCTSFASHPISPNHEHETSSAGFARRARFGVSISTPFHRRETGPHTRAHANRGSSVVTFRLSPLADFTVNQSEETLPLEISYLTTRKGGYTRKQRGYAFSLATKELVQKLTDKEPYEPYWDSIWRLDLSGERVKTLHGLSDFCPRVEELDVSNNQISQLKGVPSSIRQLQISLNCLSSLTAWGHLRNLQYLDVSGNEIDSLRGFRGLIHLRELKADNNHISLLEGILEMNGLIKLDISRNAFERLDFARANLGRLSELKAPENQLVEIRSLDRLPMLRHLDLDDNNLSDLKIEESVSLPKLRVLSMNGNHLEYLDVSKFPRLKTLQLDRNPLQNIDGLSSAEQLDSLSMRESTANLQDTSILDNCYEARALFLSGNMFTSFHIQVDFMNLQHLELATCGLQQLPRHFGRLMANLRTLNLNFNALKDIRPLIGIVRLKKLTLAGNRLQRLRRTAHTLSHLPTLEELDLRHNPCTLGFYPPAMRRHVPSPCDSDEDQRDRNRVEQFTFPPADAGEDEVYRRRLDVDTRFRRRVYELLIGSRCENVGYLDGLVYNRCTAAEHDEIWDRLMTLGVLYEDLGGFEEVDATGGDS
ncbi:MAG: hypothetical protein M1816_004657 [Peltula sp. TS41687]|nr:MAG: hypothetical protein M1816_004657 [Peltula sp. TS41687]